MQKKNSGHIICGVNMYHHAENIFASVYICNFVIIANILNFSKQFDQINSGWMFILSWFGATMCLIMMYQILVFVSFVCMCFGIISREQFDFISSGWGC
jgi:hypothetical protein